MRALTMAVLGTCRTCLLQMRKLRYRSRSADRPTRRKWLVLRCRYDDLVAAGSEKAAKDSGKLRVEGKDYVVQEADVMLFRTSA